MRTKPDIRRGTIDDFRDVARLYVELKHHHRSLQPRNPRYQVPDEDWDSVAAHALSEEDECVFVAEVDGVIRGFARMAFAPKPWGTSCELETLVVEEGYRDRGIGTALMERVEQFAREFGAAGVRANVLIENEEARRFYEHSGYDSMAIRFGKTIDQR